MPDDLTVHRLAAFTDTADGGNPAGVVICDEPLSDDRMRSIAADVGYSETAFLTPGAERHYAVRYFAPEAEVSFCGHATIAAGVLLAEVHGPATYQFATAAGKVTVRSTKVAGVARAALTSVEPWVHDDPALVDRVLHQLRWERSDLDSALSPAVAYAGARHVIVPVRSRETLAGLQYDFDGLRAVMAGAEITTVAVIWRESETRFHARNPFPVGGVPEDPATGAAAAALGGYLRDRRAITPPADFAVLQGEDMGRPSRLEVHVPVSGGITVSGRAVPIPA